MEKEPFGGDFRAVEMTRRIRDEMYEATKHLSDEELIRYFNDKPKAADAQFDAKLSTGSR